MKIFNFKFNVSNLKKDSPGSSSSAGFAPWFLPRPNSTTGQAMVLVTIMIGAIMATVGTVAGFLTYYEVRQSNDSEKSTMAFYAADAGIEKALLCYFTFPGVEELSEVCDFGGVAGGSAIALENNASAETQLECLNSEGQSVSCADNEAVAGFSIRSFGVSQDTERVLETFFGTKRNL